MLLPNQQPGGGAAAALKALLGAALAVIMRAHGSGLDGRNLAEEFTQV